MPYKDPEKRREWQRRKYHSTKGKLYRKSKKGKEIQQRSQKKHRSSGNKRDYQLRHLYKFSLEEYLEMSKKQNGVCAICDRPADGQSLCVDHDHKTNRIRGLLCNGCNLRLGWYEKNMKVIVNYLK